MALLSWEDYLVLGVTIVVSLGIGLYYSFKDGKKRTTRQFIFGDGNLAMIPVALSMMVSYESGIMMLGVPAEVYMYGTQWYMSQIGLLFGRLLAMYLLLPSQRKLNITSINEYFELRYKSHGLRLFSTILGILSSINYLGTVVFVPAVTLQAVTEIPVWLSIVGLMSVVVVYTIIGGFKAVVWTDAFQGVLMFGGIFAILIKGTMDSGGVSSTWKAIISKGRINMFNFNPDPTLRQSFWSLFISGIINGFPYQFTQSTFQRIKATTTVTSAKRMYMMAAVLSVMMSGLAVLEGAVMFAYYDIKGCDPLVAGQVTNENQLIPRMVTDIFQGIPCLPGLFLASIFGASISTMSSQLSSMSAVFWQDIVKPHTRPMSDQRAMLITRSSVLLFGGVGIVVAFVVSGLEGPISQIIETTDACLYGATAALFCLGWFVPCATALGAFVGGLASVLFVGWISIGKYSSLGVPISTKLVSASTERCPVLNVSIVSNTSIYSSPTNGNNTLLASGPQGLDVLYSISYRWLLPVAILVVLIVGSTVSYMQARRPVDPSLVVPVCDYLCVCLPERFREKFRCGVKYPHSGPVHETTEEGDTCIRRNAETEMKDDAM